MITTEALKARPGKWISTHCEVVGSTIIGGIGNAQNPIEQLLMKVAFTYNRCFHAVMMAMPRTSRTSSAILRGSREPAPRRLIVSHSCRS